ncbi:carbohydrate ABC transporter permease [Mameliella sediminis]|uniref:carbohydrate ABC transporter permease n=1 Tax=Mameliella sediminis TaxID=2836866 RepID=UPI001C43F032|nr:carbohydrate ABC transporter permease [Mameliella sediminis]MBY6116792.1 carbohydrate ABC transporter permease [Antarctobacter heliothermus]MBY6146545.1 carbohydrate ABC transporter permease [Mameliella alba]MBV7396447.1 carbohydrate ABC transporter permease [Mameliella sediminis]MBY6162774.1 carbohydrate ABC transporter permease [Mameliella alba]MBY6171037.1 carbohydrate ABC transporter permease [Mameliella alba]
MSDLTRTRRSALGQHALLLLFTLIVLFPFAWIILSAFKTQIDLLMGRVFFTPNLLGFENVIFDKTSDFVTNFTNSMVIGLASTVLVLIVSTLAAFSLYRLQWPSWVLHSLLGWSVIFHMVPPITLAGAWFTMFRSVGLDNTYSGIILAHTTLHLPMALWMMGVFIRDVPRELVDAALIDGAKVPQTLWYVVLPIIRPGLAATGILTFIFSWNEFPVALVLSQRQTATVPLGIGRYAQENTIAFTEMAAASTLSILPAFVLLLIAQRFIVSGLTSGAVK